MAELGMAFLNPIAAAQEMGIKGAQEERAVRAEPSRLAHEAATTRMVGAEAAKMEADAAGQRKEAELLAKHLGSPSTDGKPPSISGMLLMRSSIADQAGRPRR